MIAYAVVAAMVIGLLSWATQEKLRSVIAGVFWPIWAIYSIYLLVQLILIAAEDRAKEGEK